MGRFYTGVRSRLISSEILLGCQEAAEVLGIDLSPILREYQIKSELLKSPEGFLSDYQVINFLEAVAERSGCAYYGLLVGKYQPPLHIGALSQVLKLSQNLHSALINAMTYASLYSELTAHELQVEEGYVNFIRREPVPYPGRSVQLHILGIIQIFKMLKVLCGNSWHPTSVHFVHSTLQGKQQYLRFFECPVVFDQKFDGVVFPESNLHLPIKTADAELLNIVLAYLDELLAHKAQVPTSLVSSVCSYVRRQLGTNLCNLESCANVFGLHSRTLQRELAKQDCTFKQLLLDVRIEVAEYYLKNSKVPLVDLTDILGYRNLSAFSRAFKNTNGASPGQWRDVNGTAS